MRLLNKVAIVTGGASGIGEQTVLAMTKEGAKVIIADFNEVAGANLSDTLNREGFETSFVKVDVSNEEQVAAMVDHAVKVFGKVDILFNNAGIANLGPTHELATDDWSKVIQVNLTGVFLCAKHVLKEMVKQGSGSIVNCASVLGLVGQAHTAAYTAAKAGVINLTRTLGVEYGGQGIRINAVCPGYIQTPLLDLLDEAMMNHLISLHPVGRLGKPEEVATAVVFLASDDASFINGTTLSVDGGYTAV